MGRWVRHRLSYANVAATLALAAALGGGYAVASGNHDKAGTTGGAILHASVKPKEPKDVTLLNVPGTGKLTTGCDLSGRVSISFKNTSSRKLIANDSYTVAEGSSLLQATLAPGDTATYGGSTETRTDRVSIFPASPNAGRPQAQLQLDTQPGCDRATALVVSSER
jgi:hypothetical protein